jgi:phosphate starvation-inducible PhoH-like protein
MKMFLTRMGANAKFIITGDPSQIDLPKNQYSGLAQAMRIINKVKGIEFIYLDGEDVIRHKLVKDIIMKYDKDKLEKDKEAEILREKRKEEYKNNFKS